MLHHGSSAAPASWWTYWIARCARAAPPRAAGRSTLVPSSRISPAVSRCRPRMVRPSVVLPQPDFADQRQDLAFLQIEADAVHGLHRRHGLAQEAACGRPAATETSRTLQDRRGVMRTARSARRRPSARMPCGGARREAAPARTSRQRGANRQPGGRASGDGTMPGMPTNDVGAVGMAGEQRARVGMRRRLEDRLHRAGLDRLAGIDDAEIVAQFGDDAEIVRHEQQRDAELRDQLAQQQQDLVLRRDVERGGRLVGDHQARRAGERRRDQQALALAAGELVRIAFERALRDRAPACAAAARPGAPRGARRRSPPRVPSSGACQRMTSSSCVPTLNTGLSASSGSCGMKPMRLERTRCVQLRLGEGQQVLALEPDLAAIDRGAACGRMPMMARIRVDLPQPDSPTTPRMRPRSSVRLDIVEHARDALVGADRHLEAADVEQRAIIASAGCADRRCRAGRRPAG